MTQLSKEQILNLFRSGTSEQRVAFLNSLPPNEFTNTAASIIGADHPGMAIVALGAVIGPYCYGTNPEYGAVLAAAGHERAVEIWKSVPDHGLNLTTLSVFACNHAKALSLLGQSKDVLDATEKYVPFYESLREFENLPTLKVLRIEALVNLKRIDDADAELQDHTLLRHPLVGLEARRLKGWVDRYRQQITDLKPEQATTRPAAGVGELIDVMKAAFANFGEGANDRLKQQVELLEQGSKLDASDPQQFKKLLESLNQGEAFLTRGAEHSELTYRGKIRNASAIFVNNQPTVEEIERSLAQLEPSLAWAKNHGMTELENDAWWGIYLCKSRLKKHSEAADALIQMRTNLQTIRRGIKDPMKRGGIFGTYQYLFHVTCEQLYKAGRAKDLLAAIESSKGHAIADRLTAQADDIVDDSAIDASVTRLPELVIRERFHYLTYFVDETCVYAALVSKTGSIHAISPIQIPIDKLRQASTHAAPKLWGNSDANLAEQLAPLVSWLDDLMAQGIVEKGDHICYSSDDDFRNIPLHYLRFGDRLLIEWFSVSRVHSAFHLDRVLSQAKSVSPKEFVGILVPLKQDVKKPDSEVFLANLSAPIDWFSKHGMSGESLQLTEAKLSRVVKAPLHHKVIHFSTHGWFPEDGGNPFHESFLLLAGDDGLPDREHLGNGKLTPSAILDNKLNLQDSHVSMMACVSGLAKEGIAGDALGLDWALIQAGAASLISSHWNVSAARAADFFTRFYDKWIAQKQPRAVAFRSTMLELMNGDFQPESLQRWAAFSLTGDFR